MFRKLLAEGVGTFWLVFGGCGSAIIAAGVPELGIGFLGVSLAFGLTVLSAAYALGPISGGHFNPAVSLGLVIAGRFPPRDLPAYWGVQVAGAVVAGVLLYAIVAGQDGFAGPGSFASNGYGGASPGGYGLASAFLVELILTAGLVVVILGATASGARALAAPIAIGLALTLIHLVSIPVTNTSVNPARSTGVAFFADGPALAQLWLFWVAPLLGGALGALVWKMLASEAHRPARQRAAA